jgi:hypothetical protein
MVRLLQYCCFSELGASFSILKQDYNVSEAAVLQSSGKTTRSVGSRRRG